VPTPVAAIDSLRTAAAYLEGLINFERKPRFEYARLDLGPIRRLLASVGHPEQGMSVVHVAGSKGKGSTCLFTEAILSAAGERVGTFTSPHLGSWTERFRIDGRPVVESELVAVVDALRPHVDAQRRDHPAESPTFFDATTAAALMLFARARVDRVVLEVGLGGRLDSTNAVAPAVTCITSIELEHTDKLGTTLAAIAGEKAGIVKPGVPCVCGALPAEAREVVIARARALDAPLRRLGEEFSGEAGEAARGERPRLRYSEPDGFALQAELGVLGAHQTGNAALAVAAVRRLETFGPGGGDDDLVAAARLGLARAVLPGRLELLQRRPWLLVDVAHTPASSRALAATIAELGVGRVHYVVSVSADKDVRAVISPLLEGAASLTVTRADPIRSLDPESLAGIARDLAPGLDVRVIPDPGAAVRSLRERIGDDDLLCCTGSVYLAGIARSVLGSAGS